MRHASDGELHAYLDGALDHLPGGRAEEVREHLRTCDACRSRLDEERRLLERSSTILEGGGPGEVEAPPLEELRERARIREEREAGRRGRGWGAMPRTQALAWAATVVLALGIGWVTRDLAGPDARLGAPAMESEAVGPGAVETGAAEPPSAEEAPGRPEAQGEVPAAAESGDRIPSGDLSGGEAAVARPRAPIRSEEEAVDRGGARSEEEAAAREPVPQEEERAADRGGGAAEAPAREVASVRELADAAPAQGPTLTGRVVDEASLEPLEGAAVVLEDSAGVRHGGVLTQSDGRFVLRADRPGTYRAVVDLIGYASTRTGFFELSPDETVATDIRAPARAVSLQALTVEGAPAGERKAAEGVAGRVVPESAAAAAADRAAQGALAPEAPGAPGAARPEALELQGTVVTAEMASSHVPGLPVVRIAPETDPPGFVIVQRLASGDTLHLRWIAGPAAEAAGDTGGAGALGVPRVPGESPFLEPLPDGWSQVVVRRGSGWLVARAPLGEQDLRDLLSRPR